MKIEITGEYITIGQLLKKMKKIHSGGFAKRFLEKTKVTINNKEVEGRGSKVRIGDTVWIGDAVYKIVAKKESK